MDCNSVGAAIDRWPTRVSVWLSSLVVAPPAWHVPARCTRPASIFGSWKPSDRLGGRLRTDVVDGFRLDHGFQIFLTSYPEARALLDYQRLGLRSFRSGARIHADGRWHELLNPLREGPGALPGALLTSVATVADKWRLARLAWEVRGLSVEELFAAPATAARDFLRGRGFSERLIRLFFSRSSAASFWTVT